MTVEIISRFIFMKVWDKAGIELAIDCARGPDTTNKVVFLSLMIVCLK